MMKTDDDENYDLCKRKERAKKKAGTSMSTTKFFVFAYLGRNQKQEEE